MKNDTKLMLKKTLYEKKEDLMKTIIESTKTPQEIAVYKQWLEHINYLIEICMLRNKF